MAGLVPAMTRIRQKARTTSPDAARSFERANDLSHQLDRVAHELFRHMADLVIGAEDIVADLLLALFQLLDHGFGTADEREALLDIEVVVAAGTKDRLAARLVVRPLAVASHPARMGAPADARILQRTAADGHGTAFAAREPGARFVMRLLVGLGNMDLPLQKDARHRPGMTALFPDLAIEIEFPRHDIIGIEVLRHIEIVLRREFDGGIAVHRGPDRGIGLLERLGLRQRLVEME